MIPVKKIKNNNLKREPACGRVQIAHAGSPFQSSKIFNFFFFYLFKVSNSHIKRSYFLTYKMSFFLQQFTFHNYFHLFLNILFLLYLIFHFDSHSQSPIFFILYSNLVFNFFSYFCNLILYILSICLHSDPVIDV